ncbi:PQQ-dependent sugar dehydrogenase [Marinigracilibium pacificum]|uniref:Sorbosone dehydrogenase family protein n=1 Tax=Marinigracilibium pacificum TaxID=2729599 RepID=A0A848J1I3_9BACT|nr:sorbosone dehydrogenase family protein [Marinigracilibium pacificum]NMM49208.1 sorbosone dehydrogenase family protein [Marinigracilibium pacificum]
MRNKLQGQLYTLFLLLIFFVSCNQSDKNDSFTASVNETEETNEELPLSELNLPEGFEISIYARVNNARSMVMGENNVLFVGSRTAEKVYAVEDKDGDGVGETVHVIDEDLWMPNGVAYLDGDLYVAEVNRILKYTDIMNNLDSSPEPKVVFDEYPKEQHHGWKYIAFGPDGKLYVPVGAPCNICKSDEPIFASITRMNPDGSNMEIYAEGVRNTVGFTWHPDTKEMYFTDNGRDNLGDNYPPCELNHAPRKGMHFGYPYCHGGEILDPEYGDQRPCSDFIYPAMNLGPHVAPLGLCIYSGNSFPEKYNGKVLIAEHGSWNRSKKIGYRISMVELIDGKGVSYEPFIDGWLNDDQQSVWGRPVDVIQISDGSILISDDYSGTIYKVTYKK